MVFSSISYIYYFLTFAIITYFLVPRKLKNIVLLAFSLFFYYYGEKQLVILLVFSIVFNYFYAKIIEKYHSRKVLVLGVVVNILLLVYFKYTNFFIDNISKLFNLNIHFTKIVLPIGISFFTFQGLSYLVDVYRRDVKASGSLINFGTYLSFFGQLIAGPIVRYETISKEIDDRKETSEEFVIGFNRFAIGLFKKSVIANILGELVNIMAGLTSKSVVSYWLEALASTLQLYFDFSAYSDMAIGMGLIFGFHFLENFNYPLWANSITDFWRKWHISLSSWFKDYVYIPLGGSRCSKKRQIFNIMCVWFLTGFWHGADWNFIIWGLYFGIILIIEKQFLLKYFNSHIVLGRLITFIMVNLGFVIFNHNISEMGIYFSSMFGLNKLPFINVETIYYLRSYLVIILLSLFLMTPYFKEFIIKLYKKYPIINNFRIIVIVLLILISTAYLVDASFNPFLYFRF